VTADLYYLQSWISFNKVVSSPFWDAQNFRYLTYFECSYKLTSDLFLQLQQFSHGFKQVIWSSICKEPPEISVQKTSQARAGNADLIAGTKNKYDGNFKKLMRA
jgi:hypothetical protein